jgi:hypothetical protein
MWIFPWPGGTGPSHSTEITFSLFVSMVLFFIPAFFINTLNCSKIKHNNFKNFWIKSFYDYYINLKKMMSSSHKGPVLWWKVPSFLLCL